MPTNPSEFKIFIELLTKEAPEGYKPHLIALEESGKDPVKGFSWEKTGLTIQQAIDRLKTGKNIGIAALTKDRLIIVDRDDLEIKRTKKTLTCTSRKRIGEHDFYFRPSNEGIPNIPTEHQGEVRANNQYVVAPGSYVPCEIEETNIIPKDDRENQGKYTIKDRRTPTQIQIEELPQVFLDQYFKAKAQEENKKISTGDFTPHPHLSPLYKLTFKDIIPNIIYDTRMPHPLHGSDTGKNFIANQTLGHCWRHNVSLTVPQYLAVKYKILTCVEAGNSHTHGGSGPSKLTKDEDLIKKVWEGTTKEGYVKRDDKPPSKNINYDFIKTFKKGNTKINFVNTGLLAKYMLNNGQHYKTFNDTEEIRIYKDGVYIKGKANVSQTTQQLVIKAGGSKLVKNVHTSETLGYIKRATYIERSEFDKNLDTINFKNGLLDIKTRTLNPHNPEYLSVTQVPHNYNPDATCPKWDKFLTEVLPNQTDRQLLQEAFGYCFINGYPYHVAFLLEGKGGNGKGTTLHTLERVLGEENISNKELQELDGQRFSKAGLYGKMANVAADIPNTRLRKTGTFKSLTGGDRIYAEHKHQDGFEFRNKAKLFFSANEVPQTDDDTDAFFQRWKILTYPNTIRGTPKEDSRLEDKLKTELEGIVAWSIKGLYNLLDNNGFNDNTSTDEKRDIWIRKSDTIASSNKAPVILLMLPKAK